MMTQESGGNKKNDNIEGLLHFYEIKMQGMGSYSSIVWSRFNWFVTLELALLGFLITKSGNLPEYDTLKLVILVAGVIVSAFWLILGILDYRSLGRHSESIRTLSFKIEKILGLIDSTTSNTTVKKGPTSLITKMKRFFRQTVLLCVLPLVFIICWGAVWVWLS